ncbi:MAG: DUF805 domain-containing protein [Spirillospora sp.]
MKMQKAVESGFRQAFVWRTRASRSEFWWFTLFGTICFWLFLIAGALLNEFIIFVWPLLFIVPYLGVAVRRLHDSDRSGAWMFLHFVPYGGIVPLIFYCLPSTLGPNRYGFPSDPAAMTRAAGKLGRQYGMTGQHYVAAGYTAMAVVYGHEAGKDIGEGLAILAGQREALGERTFRQRLWEVLDGHAAETLLQTLDESYPPPDSVVSTDG